MSADTLRAGLLSKGYFPSELPRPFTTDGFGAASGDLLAEWARSELYCRVDKKINRRKWRAGAYLYDLPKAEIEIISTPKRGYERRNVHITHPIPQALLAHEIATNYPTIQKWLIRRKYSLDEVSISQKFPRAIKGISFALHRAKKAYIEATSDWLVKTDITRFYPSIYTHSIAWAAYGKEKVKGNLKQFEGSLADRLDLLVRACNRNQTVGIPVGPETSRVIAEIISSRIDADFSASKSPAPSEFVDRLQDDWFIGVKTLEQAEACLSEIVRVYRAYGLDINGSKTSVSRVVSHLDEAWKSEIGAFLSHRSGPLRGARLREFLTLTLRLQTSYEKQAVLNYALTVLENHRFAPGDAESVESFLLKAAVVSPGSMSRICEMLINLENDTKRVSKKRIGIRFTELANRNLLNGNTYEALWLIFTLRGLRIQFNSKTFCELAAETPSSAIALVLLDIRDRGLLTGKLPIAAWETMITPDRIKTDWTWLMAYEGCRRGWLRDLSGVLNDPFFVPMLARNISFYDETKNVRPREKVARLRRAMQKRQRAEVSSFLLMLRDIDIADDY